MTIAALQPHPIFVAGRWVESPDLLEVANPARPNERAGATYNATAEQYEDAVKKATEKAMKHWTVKDGVIHYNGKNDNLQTVKDYANFEMYVDWKIEPSGDSGINLREPPIQMGPHQAGGKKNRQGPQQATRHTAEPS
jgi:hypothetical protein